MAYYTTGPVKVFYHGIDVTEAFTYEGDISIDLPFGALVDYKGAEDGINVNLPDMDWTLDIPLTFVRVRPAAPIGACLWRRNLDGGKWRKRGHMAHRR